MNKSIKIFLNYFLGPLLFIVISASLYKQIIRQPDLHERWAHIRESWQQPLFWMVVLMLFVNWGLEARKWQLLVEPLERLSFTKAFKSVLAGCSVTMITPNRIGEYGGRILYVQEHHRLQAIPLTILGSISQLFITVIIGTIGLIIFKYSETEAVLFKLIPTLAGDILLYASILISAFLILLYMKVKMVTRMVRRIVYLQKIVKYVELLNVFSRKQLLRILFLSFLRYLVFILQYILLLNILEVNISLELSFWLIAVFYLVMVMAPTIGFTELPVRAAASVELFSLYSTNIIGIQAASLGIWLINLVIPSVIGSILIIGIKIMKEK